MNILPLVLALVLMLSILTVEKLEKLKNQTIVQKEYQAFLAMSENSVFNKRQEKLFGNSDRSLKQLSFRFIFDKERREEKAHIAKQYRLLNLELMKILYKEAGFFKKLEQKRPSFLEELLTAIERAADAAPKGMIKRVKDLARLDVGDPELQEAFYHMLKGSVSREELQTMKEMTPRMKEKCYLSLFLFINNHGVDNIPTIEIQKAPRETLKAIFLNDEVVDAILVRRKELADSKEAGASDVFKNEFCEKRREGIDNALLNFKITKENKAEEYN